MAGPRPPPGTGPMAIARALRCSYRRGSVSRSRSKVAASAAFACSSVARGASRATAVNQFALRSINASNPGMAVLAIIIGTKTAGRRPAT